jgi:hypothetical protein
MLKRTFRTRRRRNRLDEQIAAGVRYGDQTPLGRRAAELQTRSERARLANALVEAVGEARMGEAATIKRRPQRAEVRAGADQLLALAERLRESTPIDVRGAAMVALLVNDRRSPLRRPAEQSLSDAVVAAYAALIPPHEVGDELPTAA